jgi:hypothetical protein
MRPISQSRRSGGADGGDAVPDGRRGQRVPGELGVVVGVDVDETRCDHQAGGVELLGALLRDVADGHDQAVADAHGREVGLAARTVDDRPPSDDQVVHERDLPGQYG